ncbi:hypothetical protein I7I50_01763 [Histoplasma capsulatum G186AR]|uniref:Uncharacterized protein n=1 Tax=Ajellomyces capsulatus TaxID=5037 RepID=A0A8H7Y9R1_AJECA|nr:hypothetical protein I7I52_11977 [Histoplasma capsulatum]QSS71049.1 hypothetical protein I7I50_01763 [Histoplasma capsulatum G186AR]
MGLLSRMSSKCVFLPVSSRHSTTNPPIPTALIYTYIYIYLKGKPGIFTDLFLSIEDNSPLAHARDSLDALQ